MMDGYVTMMNLTCIEYSENAKQREILNGAHRFSEFIP